MTTRCSANWTARNDPLPATMVMGGIDIFFDGFATDSSSITFSATQTNQARHINNWGNPISPYSPKRLNIVSSGRAVGRAGLAYRRGFHSYNNPGFGCLIIFQAQHTKNDTITWQRCLRVSLALDISLCQSQTTDCRLWCTWKRKDAMLQSKDLPMSSRSVHFDGFGRRETAERDRTRYRESRSSTTHGAVFFEWHDGVTPDAAHV
jgi:hypothetical protein